MKYLNWHWLSLLLCFPLLTGCPLYSVSTASGSNSYISEDRRTSGIFIEDEGIELKASRRIHQQLGNSVHINVTSYNRIVLLTGEAPTEAVKTNIERLVMGVDNVRRIHNEIAIAANTALSSRSNDTLLTSKVKARFLAERKFQINHVKIVTENGVVYLLGMVTREEGDNAAQIASSTSGVRKVVKAFEYLN
ncbi:BON domain-containing protein [Nitrosomonas ureae]|uniref:Osmotically-inducible protein OsmY, contains BON domain n=1 Tax=Nitrosomonas ureae TaxID=44577 RepID=A0A0S3AGT2_9PROT|nr:BON domain-containing protein [Nitrosomonas ureae]ALQ50322.1 transporter [Nitrosomonas ureae]PXX18439.1 osmotically-inducible protein OsmY [Nitrosomonas ureae]SDT94957.1 Osmotically-inducible protein OsmY, contains BON domain [Nitrosomonas ureae]SEP66075.1 Osmotically-inducible protein OsmY, contains BON domain [Nitrosomonas ureae]